jgi:hypothetical protein
LLMASEANSSAKGWLIAFVVIDITSNSNTRSRTDRRSILQKMLPADDDSRWALNKLVCMLIRAMFKGKKILVMVSVETFDR